MRISEQWTKAIVEGRDCQSKTLMNDNDNHVAHRNRLEQLCTISQNLLDAMDAVFRDKPGDYRLSSGAQAFVNVLNSLPEKLLDANQIKVTKL